MSESSGSTESGTQGMTEPDDNSRSAMPPPPTSWYLASNGTTQGPCEHGHVLLWLKNGQLPPTTVFCPVGGQEWRTAHAWPQLAAFIPHNSAMNDGPPHLEQRIYEKLNQVPGLIQLLWTRLRAGWSALQQITLDERSRIHTLAIWHRRFTLGIVGLCIVYAPLFSASGSLPIAIRLLLYLTAIIAQVVLVVGLVRALNSKVLWIWALLALLPYIGGFVLLIVSRMATKELQKAGIEIGLFGPKSIPPA